MRSFEARQEARRRAYALAGGIVFLNLIVIGAIMLFAASRKTVHKKVYKDPAATLLALCERQSQFRQKTGRYASTLAELEKAGFVGEEFLKEELEGYRYKILDSGPTSFSVAADPASVGSPDHFFVDESQTVRVQVGGPANRESAVVYDPRSARQR